MSNIKISDLTSASGLTGAELIPIVQENTTVKTTAQAIADLAGGGGATVIDIISDGTVVNYNQGLTYRKSGLLTTQSGNQSINILDYPEMYLSQGTATFITIQGIDTFAIMAYSFSNLTTFNFPDLKHIIGGGMVAFDINGNPALTTISFPQLLTVTPGTSIHLNNNALSQATVDYILNKFVSTNVNNCTIFLNGGTNAAPSAAGLADKDILVSRGWTVSHT